MSKPEPMGSAKITTKGQICIPVDLRERLKLKPGDRLFFFVKDDRIIMAKEILLP